MYIKNFAAPPATKVTRYTIVYQPYQAASTALKDQRPCNAVYGPTLAPAADKQHIISTAFELSPSKEHMQCGLWRDGGVSVWRAAPGVSCVWR